MKLGLFGGSFDPVHYGHLHLAWNVLQHFKLDRIYFIPCKQSVYRETISPKKVSAPHHRIRMLEKALQRISEFELDLQETERDEASYTLTTLKAYRQHYPSASLVFIVGSDAFATFSTWYGFPEHLEFTHFVVVARSEKDFYMPPSLQQHRTHDPQELTRSSHGKIYYHPLPTFPLSSQQLREDFRSQRIPRFCLPEAVLDYIQEYHLYES